MIKIRHEIGIIYRLSQRLETFATQLDETINRRIEYFFQTESRPRQSDVTLNRKTGVSVIGLFFFFFFYIGHPEP